MANSPSHKFGQIIGNLLEELIEPYLASFCKKRGLYLDRQGERAPARKGKKVTWIDKYGNKHDLDFVIERFGTKKEKGKPVAFIEAAWRRYTKHSRNKTQEIQGAILPIADKYNWDVPFLGVVLAGIFTDGSLQQLESTGFNVLYFPYDTITHSFEAVDIDVKFDELTKDSVFSKTIKLIEGLPPTKREKLKQVLADSNKERLNSFFEALEKSLDRIPENIIIVPLHGHKQNFDEASDAIKFITDYNENIGDGPFVRYEIIIKYSNSDKIDATFTTKTEAIKFLNYVLG